LNHLHLVLSRDDLPQPLLRARLALRAAAVCVTHQGRPERAGDLRDAVEFLQPGASPGPAGEIYLSWRRAVERPVSVKVLDRALPEIDADQIATWLDGYDPRGAGQGAPVSHAAAVFQAVIEERRRDHTAPLLLADAALAQALGWSDILPLLALGLKRTDLRKTGENLRLACHRAIVLAAAEVTREAADIARRAERLRAVAPKLRARGANEAVALFLNRDAVAPAALTCWASSSNMAWATTGPWKPLRRNWRW